MSHRITATEWAAAEVNAVRDDPAARLALVARTYRGPTGRAPQHLPYRRAAISFMRWQVDRGVLDPLSASPPGSPWWRAVNERLLRDGCEAMARSGGLLGEPSSPTIGVWMSFIATPTARSWYRAHNASIVGAYLDQSDLAVQESVPERFFLNLVLVRVLYAHALVAAPRLALGRFARLGSILGDPRLGMVGAFLSLRRVLPDRYPLARDLEEYLADEQGLGRMLDYGVIVPRIQRLYDWSAEELGYPALRQLCRDGSPSYAENDVDGDVWSPARVQLRVRALRFAIPAS
ncbi:MAG TPA: hypothetical protein VH025_00220 [Solirubrobacteraceae bacterium]|jgi:hypothetical protein|nr:hypothetical protein [Solirubrobacteraceae bacterium]